MSATAIGDQEKLRRQARVLLFGAVSDVAVGAVFLWGDRVLPTASVPGLGLTPAQLIAAALILVGAPFHYLLYSRTRSRLERAVPFTRVGSGRDE